MQTRRDFFGFVSALVAMLSFGSLNLGASTQTPVLARASGEAEIGDYDFANDDFDPDGWL
jgi:hypothetical protein